MIYGVNDRLPFNKLIFFSIQMVLSVFVATTLIATICGTPINSSLLGAGLATLIYILITKFQSPMFISSSGAFVVPIITALSIGGYLGVAIGGIVICSVYFIFGLIFSKISSNSIYKIFPKSLIGAVTVVIGINLMPFIYTYLEIEGSINMWGVSIALVTMITIALLSHYSKGIWKILPFLGGILIGYTYSIILTITGIFPIIDFSLFKNLTLFSLPQLAFMNFEFNLNFTEISSIIILFIAYGISAMMECLSDHGALGGIIGIDLYNKPGLNRIFFGQGFANLISTFTGGLGVCSYGEGVACVGFSKVASTFVTMGAAIILIIMSFLTPIQAFVSSIPSCVFGGAAIILYGFIACSGVKMLQNVDLNIQKNLIITSSVLSLGISGVFIGTESFSIAATALALIIGIILNITLKENYNA